MNAATGDFAVVEYHVFDDTATSWGNARLNFYGSLYNGVPFFVYNGKYDAWPISNYDDALLAELDIPTDVTIHMFGVPGIGVTNTTLWPRCASNPAASARPWSSRWFRSWTSFRPITPTRATASARPHPKKH
jgi:hypothetical protein